MLAYQTELGTGTIVIVTTDATDELVEDDVGFALQLGHVVGT